MSHIKTSKENREVIAQLTRKLGLGTENIISRMAYTYSLSKDRKLELSSIKDSGGKEYARSVLFGEHVDFYIGLVCVHYGLYRTDKDIPKYIKMHVDDGLTLLNEEVNNRHNIDGFDFLVEKIHIGLNILTV